MFSVMILFLEDLLHGKLCLFIFYRLLVLLKVHLLVIFLLFYRVIGFLRKDNLSEGIVAKHLRWCGRHL